MKRIDEAPGKLLAEEAAEWNLTVTAGQAEQFSLYAGLLLEWNEKINLTRIVEPAAIRRQHFLDSIAPMRLISFENRSLIDIGTGAGFPGIPLKIMNPSLEVTLLDALDKRCRFLQEVVDRLGLDRVTILHGRAEDCAAARPGGGKGGRAEAACADRDADGETNGRASLRGSFDYAVSRAVAKINILCEYAVPFLKVGGQFIAYKLDDGSAELDDAENALRQLGASCRSRESYALPETAPARALYFIEKTEPTPVKYPRRAGMPEKRPL